MKKSLIKYIKKDGVRLKFVFCPDGTFILRINPLQQRYPAKKNQIKKSFKNSLSDELTAMSEIFWPGLRLGLILF